MWKDGCGRVGVGGWVWKDECVGLIVYLYQCGRVGGCIMCTSKGVYGSWGVCLERVGGSMYM